MVLHWCPTATGVVLAPLTKLRFVPVADYNGNPGSLTVHSMDNSDISQTFTSGATVVNYDTSTDDEPIMWRLQVFFSAPQRSHQ